MSDIFELSYFENHMKNYQFGNENNLGQCSGQYEFHLFNNSGVDLHIGESKVYL